MAADVSNNASEACIERWGLQGRLVMVNPTILVVTSSISLVLALLILISYFSIKLLQRQPNSLIAFKAFYDVLFSSMLLVSALHTPGGIIEDDGCFCEDHPYVGVLTQFALIGTEVCLLCLSLDLIVNIRSPFTNFILQNWIYRVIITVVPGVIAILYYIQRAGNDAGSNNLMRTGRWFMGFCLLSYRIDRGVNVLLFYTLVTLGIIFVFAGFASVQSLARIRRHGRTSHGRDIFKARSHVLRLSLQYIIGQLVYWAVAWITYLLIFYIIGQKSSVINDLAGVDIPDDLSSEAASVGVALLREEKELNDLANLAGGFWALHSVPLFGIWMYDAYKAIQLRKKKKAASNETLFLAPKTNLALREELVQYLKCGITHLSINPETDVNLMGKCRLDFGNESGGSASRLKKKKCDSHLAMAKTLYSITPVASNTDTKNNDISANKKHTDFSVVVDKDDAKYASGNIWEFFKCRPVGETRATLKSYDERLFRIMRKTYFKNDSLYYKSMATLTAGSPINDPNDLDARFCFLTADERLTVQTLTQSEFASLRQMMIPNIVSTANSIEETDKSYPEYMMDNPKSLLQRFLGCYTMRLLDYNHTIYICVTVNALPPTGTVQEIYTLSGATNDRNAPWPAPGTKCVCRHCSARFVLSISSSIENGNGDIESNSSGIEANMRCPINRIHEPQRVLLDNDFRLKVILSPYEHANTLKQLQNDTDFLNTEGRHSFGLTLGVSRNRYPISNGMSPVIKLQQSYQALSMQNGDAGGYNAVDTWEGVHRSQAYDDYVTNSRFSRNAVVADSRAKVVSAQGTVVHEPILSTVVEGPSSYHMSVTDILNRWSFSDSVWFALKRAFTRGAKYGLKISPQQYQNRFMKFVEEKMVDTLRKHAEIRCLGPDKRPRRLTIDLNDIFSFKQLQQCVNSKKFADMVRRSGVPELSMEDIIMANARIDRTKTIRAKQLFDEIKLPRTRRLTSRADDRSNGIAVFDFIRPDRPLGWREERLQKPETKEMEEAAALSILDDQLSRREKKVLSRFVSLVKDRLYEANLSTTLDDLRFPKVKIIKCVEELREPRELFEQPRKVREYGKTATAWLRGMQNLVEDFNLRLKAVESDANGGDGGLNKVDATTPSDGQRASQKIPVTMMQRLNRMLYVTLLIDGGIKDRAGTGLDKRRMKAENLTKKSHKALMRDLDPLIRSVIMNKRFLQLALRMVEYSALTLERVDLTKRIDSVRRIIKDAAEMMSTTRDFDIAALPEPTEDQIDWATNVLHVANKSRRILLEVARLEQKYPIDHMVSLVDQKKDPMQRKLHDIVVRDNDEKNVNTTENMNKKSLRIFRRKSMRFREKVLDTQIARRTLQKIYNLEAIATPMHIPSDLLKPYFNYWRKNYSHMSFQRFIFYCPFLSSTQMRELAVTNLSLFTKIMCEKGLSNGIPSGVQVRYLRNSRHRKPYEAILCHDGLFINHEGQLFDTADMESNFSGRGFGICSFLLPQYDIYSRTLSTVLSKCDFREPEDGLFLGTHRVRYFHHSTFFGGQKVDFAGEMQLKEGRLTVITNKSGHYKPGNAEILVMLNWLYTNLVDLSQVEFRTVHDVPEDSDEHYVSHNARELRLKIENLANSAPQQDKT